MDKTSDFPDAIRQFAVQSLAMVYSLNFPRNPYRGHTKIRDWTIAAIDYWARIQHGDGSFDEFYPFERGWSGPTAFVSFSMIEACSLLKEEMPDEISEIAREAIRRAAQFIAAGESEEDHLANHHAMSYLAVWKAAEYLGDEELTRACDRVLAGFMDYHESEGWSREYDGVDPGYLSATVSFLAKVYRYNPRPELLKVLTDSIDFCSYFVYPNGFYAGSVGSRNTLHFWKRRTLFAARDRLGIKPFYFWEGDVLLFSSEIKSLLQHPRVHPAVDYRALQDYLDLQYCLGDKTLFSGIRRRYIQSVKGIFSTLI